MNGVASDLALHILLAGAGAGLVAAAALTLRRCAGGDAVLRYRVLAAFLPAALLIIPLQAVVSEYATPRRIARPAQPPTPPAALAPISPSVPVIISFPQTPIDWFGPNRPAPGRTPAAAAATNAPPPFRAGSLRLPGPPTAWARALLVVYLAVASALAVCTLVRACRGAAIVRRSRPVDGPLLHRFERLQRWAGVRARLLESDELSAPASWGLWRRAVVLPCGPGAGPTCARAVLLHELVHLRRRDALVSLARHAITAAFWFQPLVWLYARALAHDQELSCDAAVVRATGRARAYALHLLSFGSAACAPPSPLIGLGSAPSLRRRIVMLGYAQNRASSVRRRLLAGAGLAGLLAAAGAHAALSAAAGPGPMLRTQPEQAAPPILGEVPIVGALFSQARQPAADQPAVHRSTLLLELTGQVAARDAAAQLSAVEQAMSDSQRILLSRVIEGAAARPADDLMRVTIVAPRGGRSAAEVYDRLMQIPEFGGQPGMSVTDQDSVLSVEGNARVVGDTLEADVVRLSLPEGSRLHAAISGRGVALSPGQGGTGLSVGSGEIRIIDRGGVTRVRVMPSDGGLILGMVTFDEGEVNFELAAQAADGGRASLRAEYDSRTGVPEGEKQPPHGANRWRMFPAGDGKPHQFKMQWIYDMDRLEQEAAREKLNQSAPRPEIER